MSWFTRLAFGLVGVVGYMSSDPCLIKVLQMQNSSLQKGLGWLADMISWIGLKVLVAIQPGST